MRNMCLKPLLEHRIRCPITLHSEITMSSGFNASALSSELLFTFLGWGLRVWGLEMVRRCFGKRACDTRDDA